MLAAALGGGETGQHLGCGMVRAPGALGIEKRCIGAPEGPRCYLPGSCLHDPAPPCGSSGSRVRPRLSGYPRKGRGARKTNADFTYRPAAMRPGDEITASAVLVERATGVLTVALQPLTTRGRCPRAQRRGSAPRPTGARARGGRRDGGPRRASVIAVASRGAVGGVGDLLR
jgi:hypothetical protein